MSSDAARLNGVNLTPAMDMGTVWTCGPAISVTATVPSIVRAAQRVSTCTKTFLTNPVKPNHLLNYKAAISQCKAPHYLNWVEWDRKLRVIYVAVKINVIVKDMT